MWAVPNKDIFGSSLLLIAPRIFPVCFFSSYLIFWYYFIPHILVVSIYGSSYLESFLVVFSEVFLSDNTAISMSLQVFFLWSLYRASWLLFLYLLVVVVLLVLFLRVLVLVLIIIIIIIIWN